MSSSRGSAAWLAVVLGVLAVLVVPGAVLAAQQLNGLTLLHALYVAAPVSVALGLLALLASRRARLRSARSLQPSSLRAVRITAWAGFYVGVVAAGALGFYGILVALGS